MLKGKKIVVGITGSIAAYKAAILVRLLVKEGADVKVIMTALAKEFITPLTMATLSKHPIMVDFYNPENGDWNSHVETGIWADAYLIAPATANTMAKMANGVADNLLLTTYLSARCPVFVAPAMDLDMYQHPATQRNIEVLRTIGNQIIEPEEGELASGLSGKGRMAEPEHIVTALIRYFSYKESLAGKTFMVTAGPTHESIDPVRFIGNHSSGKMGYALAEELASRSANVILVSGPTNLHTHNNRIKRINVTAAAEMYAACIENFPSTDGAIMTAAVADFTTAQVSDSKIKRQGNRLTLELVPTKDIAAELGKIKKEKQIFVGFALENEHELENARKKLLNKNLDFIVLNSLQDKGAGFNVSTNKITIIDKKNQEPQVFRLKSKQEVAKDIINKLELYL
ncbi:MAG: bifunctional phosphopantothenoylcysteine decarboxylase/phosphopantothenate--cysteine ligase CoaBC [Prevotellaceae bacterium]|jgi:phosphopantothenoylcysteine decarboxylase/phosphopantothenate--cysteine ligase|nr:bifunctional phosphopantothenoylcysteine decarboxylase/phosphopantothenate--cysteine ligase CoaBC [Prevotellaceae bacterium]